MVCSLRESRDCGGYAFIDARPARLFLLSVRLLFRRLFKIRHPVPFPVIAEVVDRIKDGSIASWVYDPESATLHNRI